MQANLQSLLERLLKNDIDFVLVGGLACTLHGSPITTKDIDICISIDETQIGKLREALKDLSPKHRMNPNFQPSFLSYPESLKGVNNIYLETDLGVLDILSVLKPVGSFDDVKKRAITVSLFGYSCRVVSLDDLIRIKETMTRPKDKETLLHLREIAKRIRQ